MKRVVGGKKMFRFKNLLLLLGSSSSFLIFVLCLLSPPIIISPWPSSSSSSSLVVTVVEGHESCCKHKLLLNNNNDADVIEEQPEYLVDINEQPPTIDIHGNLRYISDPTDYKPSLWDDEDDGEWKPRLLLNPDFKWEPKLIRNPTYVKPPSYKDKLIVEIQIALPWVILGIIITGLLNTIMDNSTIKANLITILKSTNKNNKTQKQSNNNNNNNNFISILIASIIGLVTPLCSCGTLPIATSFINNDILSLESTISFLIASQSAGLDSAAITYGLLGPTAALFRLLGAILLSVSAGMVVMFINSITAMGNSTTGTGTNAIEMKTKAKAANAAESSSSKIIKNTTCCTHANNNSCCDNDDDDPKKKNMKKDDGKEEQSTTTTQEILPFPLFNWMMKIWLTICDISIEIIPTVFVGLMASAIALHYFPSFIKFAGSNLLSRTTLLLFVVPLQLCEHSTATLAAGLQKKVGGGSVGLSFAFLLSAPAINMPTLLFLLLQCNNNNNHHHRHHRSSSSISGFATIIGVVIAIIGSSLIISYIVDLDIYNLSSKLSLLVVGDDDKDSQQMMAELPTWYINIVPYLASSMICTGCIRYYAKKYGTTTTKKNMKVVVNNSDTTTTVIKSKKE